MKILIFSPTFGSVNTSSTKFSRDEEAIRTQNCLWPSSADILRNDIGIYIEPTRGSPSNSATAITARCASTSRTTTYNPPTAPASATSQYPAWYPRTTLSFQNTTSSWNLPINSKYMTCSKGYRKIHSSRSLMMQSSRVRSITTVLWTAVASSPTNRYRKAYVALASSSTTTLQGRLDTSNAFFPSA
jgi:hypothetical protein